MTQDEIFSENLVAMAYVQRGMFTQENPEGLVQLKLLMPSQD